MLTDLCRRSIVDAWDRSYLGNLGCKVVVTTVTQEYWNQQEREGLA